MASSVSGFFVTAIGKCMTEPHLENSASTIARPFLRQVPRHTPELRSDAQGAALCHACPVPLFSGGDAGQVFVGFGIAGEFLLDCVPVELAAGVVRDVAEQRDAGGAEADFDIGGGAFAGAHGIDERGGVQGGSVGGVHVEFLGRLAFRLGVGIDLVADAVGEDGAVGAVVGFAVGAVVLAAGVVIPHAGKMGAGTDAAQQAGFVTQNEVGVLVSDL